MIQEITNPSSPTQPKSTSLPAIIFLVLVISVFIAKIYVSEAAAPNATLPDPTYSEKKVIDPKRPLYPSLIQFILGRSEHGWHLTTEPQWTLCSKLRAPIFIFIFFYICCRVVYHFYFFDFFVMEDVDRIETLKGFNSINRHSLLSNTTLARALL